MSLAQPEQNLSSLLALLFTTGGYFSGDNSHEGRQHPQISRYRGSRFQRWRLRFAGAAAAAAPSAITGPVTSVGPTTATATGTVNPNGQATTWYVEYGTSTSYGTKTANVSAGSGTANTAVSASLTGLTAGTTYHYRVVATNSSGTDQGADGIFTTSAGPVAVTGSATSVTTTTATLNGTVDPNGRATTWYFEYGTSTSYGSKTAEKSAGSGTSTAGVSAAGVGPDAWPALPLSPRCDQRRRNEPRRGPDLLDDHGAHSGHRGRELDRPDVGEAQRQSHTEWASHDLVLRVRHGHELRHQDADEEPRLGHERRQRRRVAHGPEKDAPPTTTAWSRRTPPARPLAPTGPSARRLRLR